RAEKLVIIVSDDKLVDALGKRHPVPVETIAEAQHLVRDELLALGARECEIRAAAHKYGPVITEHGNVILDTWFDQIDFDLEKAIKAITGVVETGLFFNFNQELLVASKEKVVSRRLVNGLIEEEMIEG
ncbi:MAG: ribose-5-phosphate isomerase A, partial [Bdellovibrionales bacterium]|nr:ribose-5-phosphate isomerase A [Bdellovibrionales bacterium]